MAGKELTLEEISAFVDEVARDLDPDSRYVKELRQVIAASRDVQDYLLRLTGRSGLSDFRRDGSRASEGERGRSWVDDETWSITDPLEQTLSSLLTGETRMM